MRTIRQGATGMAINDTNYSWVEETQLGRAWVCYCLYNAGYSLNQISDVLNISPQLVDYYTRNYERQRDKVMEEAKYIKRIEALKEIIIKGYIPDEKKSNRLRRDKERPKIHS